MITQDKAPTDLEGLTEFLAGIDHWGFEADSEEQIALRHKFYVENVLGWFPDETVTSDHGGVIEQKGKDWYRRLAQAIIDGFTGS
jgi:hypothetical protein